MLEGFKGRLRDGLRRALPHLPARHALADRLGRALMPEPPVEVIDVNGLRLAIDHRLRVARHIRYGLYEQPFIRFLQRTLRSGDAFIDGGANIGYITAVAHGLVGPQGKVAAFEPSRRCLAQLHAHNPVLPPGITLLPMALAERSGTYPFMDTPRAISHGFSVLFYQRQAGPDDEVYEVETITLDDAFGRLGIRRAACIKLDIEGAELAALRGAAAILREGRADHIMVETSTLDPAGLKRAAGVDDLLRPHGYAPFLPDSAGRLRPLLRDLRQPFRADIIWKRPIP
ncbi:MAG: FkbM family methyltransferase [Flavobacteriales bacterium]